MTQAKLVAAIEAERSGQIERAVALYSEVLTAMPGCVEALNNLGAIAFRFGSAEDAVNFYRTALQYNQDFLPTRINIARCEAKLRHFEAAEQHYRRAIALSGEPCELLTEYVDMLCHSGQLQRAREQALSACAAHPQHAGLWLAAGNAWLYSREVAQAETCYRHAMGLANTPLARANLAFALLAQNRFAEAWPLYEARYHPELHAVAAVRFDTFLWPQWQGEDLAGKSILVVGEQGAGDQIQFARFVEPLAAQAAQVDVVCHEALVPLFAALPGVAQCHAAPPVTRHYHYWTPLLSLPYRLGNLSGLQHWQYPYLTPSPERRAIWRQQLLAWGGAKKKIGLVYKGAAGNAVDPMRSMTATDALRLVDGFGDGHLFVSLDKEPTAMADLQRLCLAGVIPVGDMLQSFADSAALIAELDLVLCVDTSVAHLAGALACPAWVMLPPSADWRWGKPGAEACALYPSLRLYWRAPDTAWDDTVAAVRRSLSTAG